MVGDLDFDVKVKFCRTEIFLLRFSLVSPNGKVDRFASLAMMENLNQRRVGPNIDHGGGGGLCRGTGRPVPYKVWLTRKTERDTLSASLPGQGRVPCINVKGITSEAKKGA